MEFHQRLSFLRKAAGLTQEQLGARVGVTRQAVSKWESGQVSPDVATVARLCGALNVSADFLVLGKEPEEPGEDAADEPELEDMGGDTGGEEDFVEVTEQYLGEEDGKSAENGPEQKN